MQESTVRRPRGAPRDGRAAWLLTAGLVLAASPTTGAQTSVSAYGSNGIETAAAVVPSVSGSLLVAGSTDSAGAGGLDGLLFRVGPCGDIAWSATYGGSGDDEFFAATPTADGGALVVGQTGSFSGSLDFWLVRVASDGSVLWDRSLGGPGDDTLLAVAATSDGFVVAGESSATSGQDAWVARLAADGGLIWQQAIGGPADDRFQAVTVDRPSGSVGPDVGFILAGATESSGAGFFDAWILRLLPAGQLDWQRTYGGDGDDAAHSIARLRAGGFAVAGSTDSSGAGLYDGWVAQLGVDGAPSWQRTLGNADDDEAFAVWQVASGELRVVGSIRDPLSGASSTVLLALDSAGDDLWQRSVGGGADEFSVAGSALHGGRLASAGSTSAFGAGNEDAWVVVTDDAGRLHPDCGAALPVALEVAAVGAPGSPGTAAVMATDYVAVENGVSAVAWSIASSGVCDTTPAEVSSAVAAQPLVFASAAELIWEPAAAACATSFDLYRGEVATVQSGDYGVCLSAGIVVPAYSDPAEPSEGTIWTYLVSAEGNGVSGGLGSSSLGLARQPAAACPGSRRSARGSR